MVAFTDENGRYSLDLTPGVWEIEVTMPGFLPARAEVTVEMEPAYRDWTIEMPRPGEKGGTGDSPVLGAPSAPVHAPGATSPSPAPTPGFQSVDVSPTAAGQQQLAAEAKLPPPAEPEPASEDSLLMTGSTSGGLAAAASEVRHAHSHGGASAGPAAPSGMPSAAKDIGFSGKGVDPLGMGGFGAAGASGGFGLDSYNASPAGGRPSVQASAKSLRKAGKSSSRKQSRRAPYNGQFIAFGNKRTQPKYRGSAYFDLNNSVLNAAPYSLNGQTVIKPASANARFGINVGGPLAIPKLYSSDRFFVYFNYTGRRARSPYTAASSLPTALERAGDFSQAYTNAPVQIFDPTNHNPFPGNVIPASRINPAAQGLLRYFPLPAYSGIVQNYQLVTAVPSTSDSMSARLIAPISTKDRLSFSGQYSRHDATTQHVFGFRDTSGGYGMSAAAGWSHSFKPRVYNSLNFALSRSIGTMAPYFAYGDNVAAELGIVGPSQDPINYGPPNLSFTNFGALSDGSASVYRNQTANLSDSLTYVVKGKHNLTFGYGYRRLQQNSLSYANSRGTFSFSGLLTSGFDANGQPLPGTGFDFADFLLGMPQTSSLRIGSANNYFRSWSTNGYAQDDWRVRHNLSLNFGIRYEFFAPYTELQGHLANMDISPAMNGVAVVTPGHPVGPYSGKFPSSMINSAPLDFSPRFGFSYRPSSSHSTVIRGGYGIFYSGSAYGQFAARMAVQPPFATTASLSTSSTNLLTLQNGFPAAPKQTVTNTYAIDRNWQPAYAQTWTLALQQTLPQALLVEVEYLGTKGTGLDITEQPNRAPPGSPLTAQQRLQIGNATGFTYETSQGNSIFHAGQVRLTRRFQRGISAVALYTFSKSIDNASSFGGGGGVVAQNPDNLRLERGLSTFDTRHRLSVQWVLSSPVGVHGLWRNGGWKTKAFTGWMLTGGFTAISGLPLTARVSGNLANTGGTAAFGSGRAEATGADINDGDFPYFNLNAFTLPPAGEYGDAGRNTIPGLFRTSLNAAINRVWRFGETKRQFQLRLSANNALNHVVITNVGTVINSATYGLPIAALGTRIVTLTLRFNF